MPHITQKTQMLSTKQELRSKWKIPKKIMNKYKPLQAYEDVSNQSLDLQEEESPLFLVGVNEFEV